MAVLTCVACRKVIDAEPPRCPACGAAQSAAGATRVRSALLALVTAGGLLSGGVLGRLAAPTVAAVPKPLVSAGRGVPAGQFMRRAAAMDEAKAHARHAVNEWAERLRKDPAHPFVRLEDVQVEPGKHAGRAESTIAMVLAYNADTRRASIGTGWGNGIRLDADVAGLPVEEQKRILMLAQGPNWSVFKGRWASDGVRPYLVAEEFHPVLADAPAFNLGELLDAP